MKMSQTRHLNLTVVQCVVLVASTGLAVAKACGRFLWDLLVAIEIEEPVDDNNLLVRCSRCSEILSVDIAAPVRTQCSTESRSPAILAEEPTVAVNDDVHLSSHPGTGIHDLLPDKAGVPTARDDDERRTKEKIPSTNQPEDPSSTENHTKDSFNLQVHVPADHFHRILIQAHQYHKWIEENFNVRVRVLPTNGLETQSANAGGGNRVFILDIKGPSKQACLSCLTFSLVHFIPVELHECLIIIDQEDDQLWLQKVRPVRPVESAEEERPLLPRDCIVLFVYSPRLPQAFRTNTFGYVNKGYLFHFNLFVPFRC